MAVIKSQSIGEYVILVGILALALAGMQTYLKRSIQSVVKVQADQFCNNQQEKGVLVLDPEKGYSQGGTTPTQQSVTQNITEDSNVYSLNIFTQEDRRPTSKYFQGVVDED